MSKDETQAISYKLLGIIQEYAPAGSAQQKITKEYNLAKLELDEKDLARNMAGILYDGLAYNNWPWN